MRKPGLTAVGFGLIGIGSALFASPAVAAIDCGTAPTGGTLTQSGDYCQLVFSTPGDYSFTVPTSANELFALVVGGGAGAITDANSSHEGYAGSAGKVHYKDMTDSINSPLSIHVGTGGTSGTDFSAANGGDSSVSSPSTSNYAVSFGAAGTQTTDNTWCQITNWTGGVLAVGEGSRTVGSTSTNGHMCVGGNGLGVNPSLGNVDSEGASAPEIFSDLNYTFGTGGPIKFGGDDIDQPSMKVGDGAGFQVLTAGTTFYQVKPAGGNGAAYLRWRHVATLSNTGSNAGDLSALAISLMTLGAGLTAASRMRRRVSK